MAKKRRRKKASKAPWVVFGILIVAIIIVAAIIIVRNAPNNTVTDLVSYYGLEDAADNEYAIMINDGLSEETAFAVDGEIYVRREFLRDEIDERLYYDDIENVLIITTANDVIKAVKDQKTYTKNDEETSVDYVIATEINGEIYVALDFFNEFSSCSFAAYENPQRVVINYGDRERTCADAKRKTQIRILGGVKSEVVTTVEAGTKLGVLEDIDGWLEVITEDGYKGYIKTADVGETYSETYVSDYEEPEYTHLSMESKPVIGWYYINTSAGNSSYSTIVSEADSLNVYSPTWYSLSSDGTITSRSDSSVVTKAHDGNRLVWALISDTDSETAEAVLTSTSLRQSVIDEIMTDLADNNIDGINVDFEFINSDYSEDYIEFLRELSIRCRAEGKYLSVDNYTPYSFNAEVYHVAEQGKLCDYVIVMEYDDFLGSDSIGPNSGLQFVQEATDISLELVNADQLIVGLPFYSRFWYKESDGSYVRGEYGMTKAAQIISNAGAELQWLSDSGLKYAEFTDGDEQVYAWLEDSESIREKLNLLSGYNLAGVAFWQLGQETDDTWDVIAEFY